MSLSEDVAVGVWRDRLGDSFGKAFRVFERFHAEGLKGELKGLSPSGLLRFQEDAKLFVMAI